jgi:hypothetical protein
MSNTTNVNNLKKTKSYTLDTPFNDLQIRGWYLLMTYKLGVGIF